MELSAFYSVLQNSGERRKKLSRFDLDLIIHHAWIVTERFFMIFLGRLKTVIFYVNLNKEITRIQMYSPLSQFTVSY